MAAMMPSAAGANSGNPYSNYDNDAVERDLIDPDDGKALPSSPCRIDYTLTVANSASLSVCSYAR